MKAPLLLLRESSIELNYGVCPRHIGGFAALGEQAEGQRFNAAWRPAVLGQPKEAPATFCNRNPDLPQSGG